RGDGHGPAVADRVDALGVGDPHTVEEHLVEGGTTGHLPQGSHGDARRLHVDDEVGAPAVLRDVPVAAGEQDAEVGVVRGRGPHLLTVDDPLVAVALGPGGDGGDVGAGRG